MSRLFKKRTYGVFRRFLLSYAIVFVIPLFLSFYAYNENIEVIEQGVKELGLSALQNSMVALDGRFSEICNYAGRLSYDKQLLSFAQKSSPYVDGDVVTSINDMREKLMFETINNNFLQKMFIYFTKSDVVIQPSGTHLGLDRYYNDFFTYSSYDTEQFRQMLSNGSYYNEFLPNDLLTIRTAPINSNVKTTQTDAEIADNSKGFIYMHSFPISGKPKGQIVFYVSESEIKKTLSSVMQDWNGEVFIFDEKNELFFTTETLPSEEIQAANDILVQDESVQSCFLFGEETILVRCVSTFNEWTYIMKIPQKTVNMKLEHVQWLLTVYLLLATIIGVVVVIYLAFRNTSPIQNLVALISGRADGNRPNGNEYTYVTKSILGLYEKNDDLQASLSRQIPLMRTTFVERLLSGWFEEKSEITWFLKQLNFRELNGKIIVLLVRLDLSGKPKDDSLIGRINAVKSTCEKAFATAFDTDVYYFDSDFDRRAIIFGIADNADEASMKENISKIADEICKKTVLECDILPSFSGGVFVDSYLEIAQSFLMADECMETIIKSRRTNIVWPSDLPNGSNSYYYPLAVEMRLINATKASDFKEVSMLLDSIYQENFIKRELLADISDCLVYEMKGTMMKLMDFLTSSHDELSEQTSHDEIKERIFGLDRHRQAEKMFETCYWIFEQLCLLGREDGKQKNNNIISSIQSYVLENFQDQQLNLNDMANRFDITASYLSQLFKEHTGMNFSSYLEDLRIEKACEYLLKQIPINTVAERVGYNSVYVFRNAFKRKKGISPSGYKAISEKE